MQIDGHTRLAAVVANPIKHSISPFIHNSAFEKTQVNGVYVAWEIPKSDLAETVKNIRRYDMFGINLSMPYKEAVIPFLDDLSPAAQLIGAVNTVVNRDGRLIGHNTDGFGFFASLKNFSPKDAHLMILGAGGAAKAIVTQAVLDGAKKVSVYVRPQSLDKAKESFKSLLEQASCHLEFHALNDLEYFQEELGQADLLVNATSVGMDGASMPIPTDTKFPKGLLVADIIYQPFETPFLALARKQGIEAVNGLGMLLHQAAGAFKLWTGKDMPTDAIWQELENIYNS